MFKRIKHIHFVGIGGIGMSGIAQVLLNMGYTISGSDMKKSEIAKSLINLGAKIRFYHKRENIEGADVVVYSQAIDLNNPEIIAAKEKKIPVIPRAEMLAELMRLKYSVAVSGTHGKTTTTSMTASVLTNGGLDPTIVVGGKITTLGSNAKLGKGEYLVAEADESDGSFLKLNPTISVITNIDNDHLDYYNNIGRIRDAFVNFANKVPFYGCVILCADDVNVQLILPKIIKKIITYGINGNSDIKAYNINLSDKGSSFSIKAFGKNLGEINLKVLGMHNVENALAAVAVGLELNISFKNIKSALEQFLGTGRRLEIIGEKRDVLVMDDYAHHPTEIKATLFAIKSLNRKRIIAIFQPHRFTRTKFLFYELSEAFYGADEVIITDIYPAGEKEIKGVSSRLIFDCLKEKNYAKAKYIREKSEIIDYLLKGCPRITSGDLVITFGAGDIRKVAELLYSKL